MEPESHEISKEQLMEHLKTLKPDEEWVHMDPELFLKGTKGDPTSVLFWR